MPKAPCPACDGSGYVSRTLDGKTFTRVRCSSNCVGGYVEAAGRASTGAAAAGPSRSRWDSLGCLVSFLGAGAFLVGWLHRMPGSDPVVTVAGALMGAIVAGVAWRLTLPLLALYILWVVVSAPS